MNLSLTATGLAQELDDVLSVTRFLSRRASWWATPLLRLIVNRNLTRIAREAERLVAEVDGCLETGLDDQHANAQLHNLLRSLPDFDELASPPYDRVLSKKVFALCRRVAEHMKDTIFALDARLDKDLPARLAALGREETIPLEALDS